MQTEIVAFFPGVSALSGSRMKSWPSTSLKLFCPFALTLSFCASLNVLSDNMLVMYSCCLPGIASVEKTGESLARCPSSERILQGHGDLTEHSALRDCH